MGFKELMQQKMRDGEVDLRAELRANEYYTYKTVKSATTQLTGSTYHSVWDTTKGYVDETKFRVTGYNLALASNHLGNGTANGAQCMIEFRTDANQFEFRALGLNCQYDIIIDGETIAKGINASSLVATPTITTDATGAAHKILVRLDTAITGEVGAAGTDVVNAAHVMKMRDIKILGINTSFAGVSVMPQFTIKPGQSNEQPFIWQMGDSYTFGTGAAQPGINDFRQMCHKLGLNGLAEGIGGSGWTSTQTGRVMQERVPQRLGQLNRKPDFISLALGYNDESLATNDAGKKRIYDNMTLGIKLIRREFPGVEIVAFSCATPKGITSNIQNVIDTVAQVCREQGVTLFYVSDAVTATNSTLYTASDNVHPNEAGHKFRGYMLAAAATAEERQLPEPRVRVEYEFDVVKQMMYYRQEMIVKQSAASQQAAFEYVLEQYPQSEGWKVSAR